MNEVVAVTPIDALPVAAALRDSAFALPLLRLLHITGACVLAGGVILFDLRVLGVNRSLSVRALARHLLPPAWIALVVMVPTGLLMFVTRASELLTSGVFVAKMGLLFALGCVAVGFQLGPWRGADAWDVSRPAPAAARLLALVSLAGWLAVLGCGVLLRPA